MAKYKLHNVSPINKVGETEMHFGYVCEIREDGVYAEISDELLAVETSSGRVRVPTDTVKPVAEKATTIENKATDVEESAETVNDLETTPIPVTDEPSAEDKVKGPRKKREVKNA